MSLIQVTIVTNVSTAVAEVSAAAAEDETDLKWSGLPLWFCETHKPELVIELTEAQREFLLLPMTHRRVKFRNLDESKLKRGSTLNANFEGGYNVSYLTPRAFKARSLRRSWVSYPPLLVE